LPYLQEEKSGAAVLLLLFQNFEEKLNITSAQQILTGVQWDIQESAAFA